MLRPWYKKATLILEPLGITLKLRQGTSEFYGYSESAMQRGSGASWSGLLTLLAENAILLKGHQVRVVLSNHYVRYVAMPWRSQLFATKDWQSVAQSYIHSVYGQQADSWQVDVALQGYGNPIIVSAVDRAFIEQLDQIAQKHGFVIDKIQPLFSCVTEASSRTIRRNDWLLIAEQHRILLVSRFRGCWQHFSVLSPLDDLAIESMALIRRELVNQQADKGNMPRQVHLLGLASTEPSLVKSPVILNHLKVDMSYSTDTVVMADGLG